MYYSYEISTLEGYDGSKREYKTIEQDIFTILQMLNGQGYAAYQYWIYGSGSKRQNTIMTVPIEGKYLFQEKKLFISKVNDIAYYRDCIVGHDELFFIKKDCSLKEVFKNQSLSKSNFISDLLKMVPIQAEIADSESIKITTQSKDTIRLIIES